jgi:hypothetical protein
MARQKYSASTDLSTRKSYLNLLLMFFIPAVILFRPSGLRASFIDRTVAIVDDRVLTYREIELSYLVERMVDGSKVDLYPGELKGNEFNAALNWGIKVCIVKSYLRRIAIQNPVSDEEIKSAMDKVRRYFSKGGLEKFLRYYEIDYAGFTAQIRDKLEVEYFFRRSGGFAEPVTEADVREYYEREKEGKFYGKSLQEMQGYIRRHLEEQNLLQANKDWLKGEMKKIGVRLIE